MQKYITWVWLNQWPFIFLYAINPTDNLSVSPLVPPPPLSADILVPIPLPELSLVTIDFIVRTGFLYIKFCIQRQWYVVWYLSVKQANYPVLLVTAMRISHWSSYSVSVSYQYYILTELQLWLNASLQTNVKTSVSVNSCI